MVTMIKRRNKRKFMSDLDFKITKNWVKPSLQLAFCARLIQSRVFSFNTLLGFLETTKVRHDLKQAIICFRHKVVLIQSMFRDFKLTQLIHQNSLQLALKRTAEIMAEGFKKQSAAFKKSNSKLAKDLEMIQNSVVKQVSTQVYEFLRSLNRVDRLKWKLTQN